MEKMSVIIPCYNEEESLAKLFDKLSDLDTQISKVIETKYIFVDDGSQDRTLELLNKNKSCLKNAVILEHAVNQNLGKALQTGIGALEDENYVAFLDSDCTYEPSLVIGMLEKLKEGYDIVTVSPYHPEGNVEGVPEWRLFLSKGISLIYRVLLWKKMYTFTAMVRIYRRDKIDVLVGTRSDFAFVAEMMISAIKRKYRIFEVPTTLYQREFGVSKMRLINTIKAHLEIVWKLLTRKNF